MKDLLEKIDWQRLLARGKALLRRVKKRFVKIAARLKKAFSSLPKKEKKPRKKLSPKYVKLISRLSVALCAVALGTVLVLWDMGVLKLPFLARNDRREPLSVTQTGEQNTEEENNTKEQENGFDWRAFAEDAIAAVFSLSGIEDGESLITDLPFLPDQMSVVKQPLSEGDYRTAMGFLVRDNALLFSLPTLQEIANEEGLVLTHHRSEDGSAIFSKENAEEERTDYYTYSAETGGFVSILFDPALQGTGMSFPMPKDYGKSDEDHTLVYENGLYGYTGKYLDGRRTRKFTVDSIYPTAFAYSEGFAVMADENGKVTVRNEKGVEVFRELNMILPEGKEDSLGFYYFDGGALRVILAEYDDEGKLSHRRETLINTRGQEIALPEGYRVVSLHEGILLLTDGKHYGYMTTSGAWVSDPVYSAASPFMEGLAVVTSEDGKMGLIDKEGNKILACAFDTVTNFSDGYALCYSKATGWHLLSKVIGVFSNSHSTQPEQDRYYTKMTITRGPQNTFDYEPDEIIELPPVLSTSPRTTHPENTTSQEIK